MDRDSTSKYTDSTGGILPYIDEVELGDEIGPVEKVATDEAVANFCDVWDAPKPNRFTDADVAAQAGMSGPIIPGIMAMAMMAQLLTDWGGPGSIKDLDLVFRQPVPHNRTLTLAATITDLREEEGEHLVECDILMTGTEGERYVGGKAIVALAARRVSSS
jgi:acyl dehydratase